MIDNNKKTIQLLLMDGTVNGIIKYSNSNNTTVIYKIPRSNIREAKDIKLLNQSGVYFLFGESESNSKEFFYVGQGNLRKNDGNSWENY